MGPQVFIGQSDSTIPAVVLFWVVFYVWVGSEMFLGWKTRLTEGAVARDAGSRWLLISSIWLGVALGIALAVAVPGAAFTSGRRPLFYFGIALMVAGLALRWYSIRVLGKSFTYTVATRQGQTVVEAGPSWEGPTHFPVPATLNKAPPGAILRMRLLYLSAT